MYTAVGRQWVLFPLTHFSHSHHWNPSQNIQITPIGYALNSFALYQYRWAQVLVVSSLQQVYFSQIPVRSTATHCCHVFCLSPLATIRQATPLSLPKEVRSDPTLETGKVIDGHNTAIFVYFLRLNAITTHEFEHKQEYKIFFRLPLTVGSYTFNRWL